MGIRLSRRFTKFVCLICFMVIAFKFYKSVMITYGEFKKEKEAKSQSFMLPFNIRRDGFYGIKPIYTPPMENKDIVINVKGKEIVLEEVVSAIRKEEQIVVTTSAVKIVTPSGIEESAESQEIKEVIEEKDIKDDRAVKETEKIKENKDKVKTTESSKEVKEKTTGKTYYIQLGIFKDKKNAEKTAKKASGYTVSINEDTVNGQKIYRASIEGFGSRESAMAAADDLRKVTEGELPIVRVRY